MTYLSRIIFAHSVALVGNSAYLLASWVRCSNLTEPYTQVSTLKLHVVSRGVCCFHLPIAPSIVASSQSTGTDLGRRFGASCPDVGLFFLAYLGTRGIQERCCNIETNKNPAVLSFLELVGRIRGAVCLSRLRLMMFSRGGSRVISRGNTRVNMSQAKCGILIRLKAS